MDMDAANVPATTSKPKKPTKSQKRRDWEKHRRKHKGTNIQNYWKSIAAGKSASLVS